LGVVKPGHDRADVARLKGYAPGIEVFECDLRNQDELVRLVQDFDPHEIFNFGGISSVVESIKNPTLTHEVNVDSVTALLAGIRAVRSRSSANSPSLVTAASGSIFEGVDRSPQNEDTEPAPNSPYAKSKREVISMLKRARQDEGLFVTSAILYNHESPLRGEGFVTRKISMAVARISAGMQSVLELGDTEVARDWGWAPDYVRAMQLMVAAEVPADYVLATGISHRLSFFIARAFAAAGIENWEDFVITTEANQRNMDTNLLVGDSRRAYLDLKWRHTLDFDSIAKEMTRFDIVLLDTPDIAWCSE
jgi:GDPmannose 4,6-dehydratase